MARQLRPFFVWLVVFYTAWGCINIFGDLWDTTVSHWPIAVAMAAGSYVAGATPMGGGTVGFPILVLLFDQPASIGRGFSFAVQAIGMTSASIFILCMRMPVAWRALRWSMLGAVVGVPVGLAFIAPYAPDLFVTLLFASIWASFGMMILVKVREYSRYQNISAVPRWIERSIGLGTGLFGGACIAALTGVGIDMMLFTLLVLLLRADLKIAVPTSVIIMAFTSLVGVATTYGLNVVAPGRYPVSPEVFGNWLAAAPIVIIGAPLGAFMVRIIPRDKTLVFVAILCMGQFVWALVSKQAPLWVAAVAVCGVLAVNYGFHTLHGVGVQLARIRTKPDAAPTPDLPEPLGVSERLERLTAVAAAANSNDPSSGPDRPSPQQT